MPAAYQCMFLLKIYYYAYFKDVIDLFLHTAALLPRLHAKSLKYSNRAVIYLYLSANLWLSNTRMIKIKNLNGK